MPESGQGLVALDMSFVLHQAGVLKVNQSFIFDVRDLKNAQISVHVVARGVLGIEEALGHITSLSVLDLLEVLFSSLSFAKWKSSFSST